MLYTILYDIQATTIATDARVEHITCVTSWRTSRDIAATSAQLTWYTALAPMTKGLKVLAWFKFGKV